MIVRAIGNPSPVPWALVVKNASKIVVSLSTGMPRPESVTANLAVPESASLKVRIFSLPGFGSHPSMASRAFIAGFQYHLLHMDRISSYWQSIGCTVGGKNEL